MFDKQAFFIACSIFSRCHFKCHTFDMLICVMVKIKPTLFKRVKHTFNYYKNKKEINIKN